MARRSFTKKDRARIFNAHLGVCHICQGKIGVAEPWEIEHVIPYALTQDDSDPNLRPAHIKCHKRKTHKEDRPRISKAERMRLKHLGAYPEPIGNAKLQSRGFASTRRFQP
jgi:5-methylcytosine-specific restriction endonuclease McrA